MYIVYSYNIIRGNPPPDFLCFFQENVGFSMEKQVFPYLGSFACLNWRIGCGRGSQNLPEAYRQQRLCPLTYAICSNPGFSKHSFHKYCNLQACSYKAFA